MKCKMNIHPQLLDDLTIVKHNFSTDSLLKWSTKEEWSTNKYQTYLKKKNTKRFNFRSSHTLKIRFSKIRTKEGLITRSTALKSTYRGKRGKKEGKNYHKGFWKSNQRKQWWWLTPQTPTFILKQHWQSGRDGPQFCCSLALWIQHNISGVTNLKFF